CRGFESRPCHQPRASYFVPLTLTSYGPTPYATPMTLSSHTTARLYLLGGAVLWSTGGFFIKEIDAGATSITFFLCLFAGLLLAPAVAGRRFPSPPDIVVSIGLFALLLGLSVVATK